MVGWNIWMRAPVVAAAVVLFSESVSAQQALPGIEGSVYDGETGMALSSYRVELYSGSSENALEEEANPARIDTVDGAGAFAFGFSSEAELSQVVLFFQTPLYNPGTIGLRDPGGNPVAAWSAHYTPEDFRAGVVLRQEVYVYPGRIRTDVPSLVQFVFFERPDTIHADGRAIVLVHGLGGTSGYWGRVPDRLADGGYDVWRLYYPKAQRIEDSAALLGKALDRSCSTIPAGTAWTW